MFRLIGKLRAVPGARDDLLLAGLEEMPGCQGYVVARDLADLDGP
ncbi:hypothetical protein DAETH_17830 [Deinococcus aetherius]|uniref:Antibiotic biosynthesis monooxygenase n=1 Tax=Deinococcus aetherius TaxID=200252 RepID=A0ABM8ADW8_9DEIO|nr:antibiotic biosynthesis monooxygenase [Deinococcus aetherius]BDP41814.1 hypothetical protein DAETH_17830 [Deinococcus aetherius]